MAGICGEANVLTPIKTHSQSQAQLLAPKCQYWKIQSAIQRQKVRMNALRKETNLHISDQLDFALKQTKRFLVKK